MVSYDPYLVSDDAVCILSSSLHTLKAEKSALKEQVCYFWTAIVMQFRAVTCVCIGVWCKCAGVHVHVCASNQNSRPDERLKARI
jgi:hypothetical protein